RRGSTVFFPAPDRPLPPEAAWSCWLSLRAFSSFSKSARSILTGWVGNPTVAAYGAREPQPAEATTTPAESATTQKRRSQITPFTLVAASRRTGSGGGHRGRLLPDRDQLGQHREQPVHHLQPVLLGADGPRGGHRQHDLVVALHQGLGGEALEAELLRLPQHQREQPDRALLDGHVPDPEAHALGPHPGP